MAYNELIKNFGRIRDYMREFYVYGFKRREEYTDKSYRSYDDEKRRMESILGDYMKFRRTADGKNVFLSIDSRVSRHNPLYRAWKAKSFTDGDITLHFILLSVLSPKGKGLTLSEILDEIYKILPGEKAFDESTVRKKLKEYLGEGIIAAVKNGKTLKYSLCETTDISGCADIFDFFSEVAPLGVVGSYLLDKTDTKGGYFAFKHHYITAALDSEIVCSLLSAIGEKKFVTVKTVGRNKRAIVNHGVVPLRIMAGVQSGRQYLMAFVLKENRIRAFRTDRIVSVETGGLCEKFDDCKRELDGVLKHTWGVSTNSFFGNRMESVEFTVTYGDDEQFVAHRLEREKRCGTVEKIDGNTSRFSAFVYDVTELIPWIRTFIGRITYIKFSDERIQRQFVADIEATYNAYGGEKEVGGDIQ